MGVFVKNEIRSLVFYSGEIERASSQQIYGVFGNGIGLCKNCCTRLRQNFLFDIRCVLLPLDVLASVNGGDSFLPTPLLETGIDSSLEKSSSELAAFARPTGYPGPPGPSYLRYHVFVVAATQNAF